MRTGTRREKTQQLMTIKRRHLTGLTNLEPKKELIYLWEKGSLNDKEDDRCTGSNKLILKKDERNKEGQGINKSFEREAYFDRSQPRQ